MDNLAGYSIKSIDSIKYRRALKKRARDILLSGDNWRSLTICMIVAMVASVGVKYFTSGFFKTFDIGFINAADSGVGRIVELSAHYLSDIMLMALGVPLSFGIYRCAMSLAHHSNGRSFFSCFGSAEELFRSYGIFLHFFVRGVATLLICSGILLLGSVLHDGGLFASMLPQRFVSGGGVLAASVLLSLFTAIIAIIRVSGLYMLPHLALEDPELPLRDAIRASRKIMRGRKLELLSLFISFAWLPILSALTVGVAFAAFGGQYFLIANALYCEDILEGDRRSIGSGGDRSEVSAEPDKSEQK